MENPLDLTIRVVAERVRSGALDPVRIAEAAIDRLQQRNPALNAICFHDAQQLLADAAALRNSPRRFGRLAGAICSIKDSITVAGMPSSDGSFASVALRGRDHRETRDCEMVARLRHEGALILGKSNMAELGRSYVTDNPLFGRTNNPYDLGRTPGGSGGGDSAALAARMVHAGLGSDAGGSVRIPAAFSGVFGLFPSRGAFSSWGMRNATHTTRGLLRNHGPLARSLDDLQILFEVLCCYDARDPFSHPYPVERHDVTPGRYLLCEKLPDVTPDSAVRAALATVASALTRAGFAGEPTESPTLSATRMPFIVMAGQAALEIDDLLAQEAGAPHLPSAEGAQVTRLRARMQQHLAPLTSAALLRSWAAIDELRAQAQQLFSTHQFLLAPVAATVAPVHDSQEFLIDGVTYRSEQVFHFSSMVNALGLVSVAFPVTLSGTGLPVGLQLIGPRHSEHRLFAALRRIGFTEALPAPTLPPHAIGNLP